MGLVHEFEYNAHLPYTGKLEYVLEQRRQRGNFVRGVVGQVSDDTESAMTTLNTLLETKGVYQRYVAISNLLAWVSSV